MKTKHIFTIIQIALLVIGNIWCYIANDRLLHTTTNIVMILLIAFLYVQNKNLKP
jgi:hypothetical protein